MTQRKMTNALARDYVARIEALNDQVDAVHAEIVQNFADGPGGLSVICDVVKARKAMRDAEADAIGLISSFDVED